MEPIQNATVYIVDDDASVREALAWLLRSRRLTSETFASAEAFDERISGAFAIASPSCALLDVRMGALSGLAMFEKLIGYGLLSTLPVIFLTGHADVPTAVETVKRGAFDFCEKPFSDNLLVDRIEQALMQSAAALAQLSEHTSLRARLEGLTERERDVVKLFFGININHGLTLEEIGAKFDLTRERVRQIKEKAIRRLRHASRSKALKTYLG